MCRTALRESFRAGGAGGNKGQWVHLGTTGLKLLQVETPRAPFRGSRRETYTNQKMTLEWISRMLAENMPNVTIARIWLSRSQPVLIEDPSSNDIQGLAETGTIFIALLKVLADSEAIDQGL
jgi:hypothetical protein